MKHTSESTDKLEGATPVEVENVKRNRKTRNDNKVVHWQEKMNESMEMEGKLKDDVDSNMIVDEVFFDPREENEGCYYEDEEEKEPVFDGTEIPGMDACRISSSSSVDENHITVWPDKAVALKNIVRDKSMSAVSNFVRRVSGKRDDLGDDHEKEKSTTWNPLCYFGFADNNKVEQPEVVNDLKRPIITKGRVILYTNLGCEACKEIRKFLYFKRLQYVEINIDLYPGRKLELEKITGSSAVPKIFFNEMLIGGLDEIKKLDASGKLKEKMDYVISELPSPKAPLPPLSGEDDASSSGQVDEFALIVKKMKKSVVVKDRFYKMRWFANCFVGSEAVDFITKDQRLRREEAVQVGRKLAEKLFLQSIFDENVFEDSNHLYRFLDDHPFVATKCYNIPRGIIESKPYPLTVITSRLSLLCKAIFEAYSSEDRRHIDYRSIHGSEEFARYLRIIEGLQRVEVHEISRKVKLAFFINLYNMMTIHAILILGRPAGPLDRANILGEFKYVIGGYSYSLSAVYNGVLRGNRRPPYTLVKPFRGKDKRSQVAFTTVDPLIHFALGSGTRSCPALKSYTTENIDKELIESARDFLENGGIQLDMQNKAIYLSKIFKWFSVDFGKNELEVLKYASSYLEAGNSGMLLELISNTQFKMCYQAYDWGLNC